MRKPRRAVGRDFEILNLDDSTEDDFECVVSNPLIDRSTLSNSSSDDDWSIVDDDVDDEDVITSRSSSRGDENGVVQCEANTTKRGTFSQKQLANFSKEDIGKGAGKSNPVDDWVSICDSSSQGLAREEILTSVRNSISAQTNNKRLILNELSQSKGRDPCYNLIVQNDSDREQLLECMRPLCIRSCKMISFPAMGMSYSKVEVAVTGSEDNSFEKEMVFPEMEMSESDLTLEKATSGTNVLAAVENKPVDITDGGQAEPHGDPICVENHDQEDSESPNAFFESLITSQDFCCEACDPETRLELQCFNVDNFLPTNDLYDFFPSRYHSQKFDRYGSRLRKKHLRIIDGEKRWAKLYFHY